MFGGGPHGRQTRRHRRSARARSTTRTAKPAWREDIASAASDNELVKLVNKIIIDAYQQGASDIHIEPYPGKGKTEVRFRKDGSLHALHLGAGAAIATRSPRA